MYADAYDGLYEDKDYVAECHLIEQIFESYGDGRVQDVLDLGCGSGNHAIPLAQRGYKVVGVDSSPDMLTQARRKAGEIVDDIQIELQEGDLRYLDLDQRFDATLMMFTVLGYQTENRDVVSALKSARHHLHSGGLLICDFWYGPAVLHLRPSQKVKVISTPEGRTLRVASGELDIVRHVCTVHYRLWQFLSVGVGIVLGIVGLCSCAAGGLS
jgi:SAM-dependent methyltransferase